MVLGGNERQLSPSKSFAGTWGEEIRRKKLLVKGDPDASRRFTTEAREAFSLEPFLKQKNPEPSKYNKFVSKNSIFFYFHDHELDEFLATVAEERCCYRE